jgi:Ca2+-binding RTX toxin-like protein
MTLLAIGGLSIGAFFPNSFAADINCTAGVVCIGTDGNDRITGTPGQDFIDGLRGNDIINGGPGDDAMGGQEGLDLINGGAGNDRIVGGDGKDQLYGQAGNDFIEGGNGDDVIEGHAGLDTIYGGPGADYMWGDISPKVAPQTDYSNDRIIHGGLTGITDPDGSSDYIACGLGGADEVWYNRNDGDVIEGCEIPYTK